MSIGAPHFLRPRAWSKRPFPPDPSLTEQKQPANACPHRSLEAIFSRCRPGKRIDAAFHLAAHDYLSENHLAEIPANTAIAHAALRERSLTNLAKAQQARAAARQKRRMVFPA